MIRCAFRKRLTVVGIVLVTAIVAAAAFAIASLRAADIAGFQSAVTALGNGMTQQTARWMTSIDRALSAMQAAVNAAAAHEADASPDQIGATLRSRAMFDRLTSLRAGLAGVDNLSLVDADGRIANFSQSWPPPETDVSGREFYRHFRDTADPATFVSQPLVSGVSGEWMVLLTRRITDREGRFAGAVAATIPLSELQDFYDTAMPTGRAMALLRRDGVVLASHPFQVSEIGATVSDPAAWGALVARGGGAYLGPGHLDSAPIIAFVRPLPGLPLVVESSVPLDLALADWGRQRRWVIGGAAGAIGLVIVLLRLLAGHFRRLERSERALAEKNGELETARAQLDAALTNMSHGVCFYGGDQKLIVCNRRYGEMYGLPPEALVPGTSLADVFDHILATGCSPVDPSLARDPMGVPHLIMDLANGRSISVRRQPMPDGGWVATHEDVTEQRQANAKIAFLARHDVLTGLANRALFQERMERALIGLSRGASFAVLYLDLDRFKLVNDTMGHQAGDELLRAIAGRLTASAREVDTVARLGGDEFAILQEGIAKPGDAARLANRILGAFAAPFAVAGRELVSATSIGIAVAPTDGDSIDTLIKNADLALYLAKSEGRGTFRFFEPEMDAAAQNRLTLEGELRDAITRREFELHYQRIVDLRSGALHGFEALIRWRHPTRGLIGPDVFIRQAEECGLAVPIGEWVLRQACAQARAWSRDIRVSVNLSATQFHRGDLGETVREALADADLPAARLELEVTETALQRHTEQTLDTLRRLRDLGVGIVMDGFCIGQSSLSSLRRFPFDKVKIDRAFVRDIRDCPDALCIVRAIVRLCADMGMRSVLTGVETAEQRDLLLRERCDEAQGVLFGRPRPAAELFERVDTDAG